MNTEAAYTQNEPLSVTLLMENVGDLNTGKASVLSLKLYTVPAEIVYLNKDGSAGPVVWEANISGGPATLQPYETAQATVSWDQTDGAGHQVPAGTYRLELAGNGAPISGTAGGTAFSGTYGAWPQDSEFIIR